MGQLAAASSSCCLLVRGLQHAMHAKVLDLTIWLASKRAHVKTLDIPGSRHVNNRSSNGLTAFQGERHWAKVWNDTAVAQS